MDPLAQELLVTSLTDTLDVKMAAMKDIKVRPEEHESDSDEAPEVVTKQSATQQAQTQQRQEEEARAQAKAAAKRKRKTKQETKPEQEVPELSDDVLSAVAARKEEDEAAEEEETAAELRAKKRRAVKEARLAKLMEKKTHTRQFGNIQVQTLETLENTQTRELSASAKEFLELRAAPTRTRMNVMEGHPSQFTKKQKLRSQRA
ncbi:hypothetical protein PHYPSEUDO_004167 [Phytophthora pseudosyringae]|uniref:Uncharacterized protein n=1 Tax=Phytophthora pseudosyringae TaxID=221518 RepID=A0A8T1VRX5_9STRA|nr:hypothetical protein PHYPSEUDO_004167 [Phytophthora pseudosyringae]